MPNLLEHIQTCQYLLASGNTIADARGVIQTVKDGATTGREDVSVTPVQEGNYRVHTPVTIIQGSTSPNRQMVALAENAPVVKVTEEADLRSEEIIYGALESINTSTQRCGLPTTGTVIFRKTDADDGLAGVVGDLGKGVVGPLTATTTGDNKGSVQVDPLYVTTAAPPPTDGANPIRNGKGAILGFVDNYLLVQLDA